VASVPAMQALVHIYLAGETPFPCPKLEKSALNRHTNYSTLLSVLCVMITTLAEEEEENVFESTPIEVKRAIQQRLSQGSQRERVAGAQLLEMVGGLLPTRESSDKALVVTGAGKIALGDYCRDPRSGQVFYQERQGGGIDGVYKLLCDSPRWIIYRIYRPSPCRAGQQWFFIFRPKAPVELFSPTHWYLALCRRIFSHLMHFVQTRSNSEPHGQLDWRQDFLNSVIDDAMAAEASTLQTTPAVLFQCRADGDDDTPPSTGWERWPMQDQAVAERFDFYKLHESTPLVEARPVSEVTISDEEEMARDQSPAVPVYLTTHSHTIDWDCHEGLSEESLTTLRELLGQEILNSTRLRLPVFPLDCSGASFHPCAFCQTEATVKLTEARLGDFKFDEYGGQDQIWIPCSRCGNDNYVQCTLGQDHGMRPWIFAQDEEKLVRQLARQLARKLEVADPIDRPESSEGS